jgi:hypothetical protein
MEIGTSIDIAPSACTGCGKELDMTASVGGDHPPEEGSITICFTCGHIMAFDGNLRLRDLTDKEIVAVAGDKRVLAVQHARAIYSQRGKCCSE